MAIASAVGGFLAHKAIEIVDNSLGRPLELWGQQVGAENAALVRHAGYRGNFKTADSLPTPDAIYRAYRAGLLTTTDTVWLLLAWGVRPTEAMIAQMPAAWRANFNSNDHLPNWMSRIASNAWKNMAYMQMQRPSADTIAALQTMNRLDDIDFNVLKHGLDVDWSLFELAQGRAYQSPGIDFLIQMRRLERISDDNFRLWASRIGWTNFTALNMARDAQAIPTLGEAFLASWRGAITPAEFDRYRLAYGYSHNTDWNAVQAANRPMPGPSDIVRFAVREAWDEVTVAEWGYDAEFPPQFAAAMKWQGLDWGMPITLPDGTALPVVPWPKAYWRSHWQIMSPTQAHQAYRLLRGSRMDRYRPFFPDIEPFDLDDLKRVLKVSDYPPKMRDWLAAIESTPMALATIRQGYLRGKIADGETRELLMDRGMLRADALVQMDVWTAQEQYRALAPMRAFEGRALAGVMTELVEAYKEGIIDRTALGTRLLALGVNRQAAARAGAVADSQLARAEVKETLTDLRRAWLSGALSVEAIRQALAGTGLTAESQGRYLRRWTRQRGLRRRMLSTSQLLAGVAQGALPTAFANLALVNLGWNPPDREFLLRGAVARFAQLQARDSQKIANLAKASQREQVRALKQAEAAQRRLRGQLRTTTPMPSLRRWFLLGIRSGPWVRQRLQLLGYDTSSIDAYLSQWVIEGQRSPHPEAPAAEGMDKILRRQTPLGTIKRWWQNGVVSHSWAIARMRSLGYTGESINGYLTEWARTLGKKPGPRPESAPPLAPPQQLPSEGPHHVNIPPRPAFVPPRPAGP